MEIKTLTLDLLKMLGKGMNKNANIFPKRWFNGDVITVVDIRQKTPTKRSKSHEKVPDLKKWHL